jgi:YaiO family outer membrane protein
MLRTLLTGIFLLNATLIKAQDNNAPDFQHEFSLGYDKSSIDRPGISDWHDRFIEYRYLTDTYQYYARLDHQHHFDLHDTGLEVGTFIQLNDFSSVDLAVGSSDKSDFMPESFIRIGTNFLVYDKPDNLGALVLSPAYQHSSYLNGNTQRFSLASEYYPSGINAWFTPNIGVVRDQFGTKTFSWGIGGHWQLTDTSRIGLVYADAPETENLITTETSAWRIYLRQQLSEQLIVFLNFSQLNRENSYTRENMNITLQYRL